MKKSITGMDRVGPGQAGSVTGLILAGGASRRFGADKARFPVDGRPMIAHVYAAVAAVAGDVLVGLGGGDLAGTEVAARVVRDAYPGAGPLAGIHAGLVASPTPWLLVVACDMPFVTPAALGRLLAARAPGVQAVVAQDGQGRRHPLCACYHASVRPLVAARLDAGQLRLQALLDDLPGLVLVPLPDADLRNVNAPDDLRAP
jgi:molybdopterin-guanine dinucleotide biosynthesis protein A